MLVCYAKTAVKYTKVFQLTSWVNINLLGTHSKLKMLSVLRLNSVHLNGNISSLLTSLLNCFSTATHNNIAIFYFKNVL